MRATRLLFCWLSVQAPTLAAIALAPVAAGEPAHAVTRARSARMARVDDTAHLRLLKAFGSVLVEEGYAGGTLPGATQVRMVVKASVSASFSIRARSGTIYGRGQATLHSSGRYSSFGGWLVVSRGSGGYTHARGRGRLYGTIDRRTDALTVQTIGTLQY